MNAAPNTKLLQMKFRRLPNWVLFTVPAIAIGSAMISGTIWVPRRLIEGIQSVLGPGMGSDSIFAGITLLLLSLIFRRAGVRGEDLGLGRGALGPAVLATLALWLVAIVLLELLSNVWAGHRPGLHSVWYESGGVHISGALLGAILGATMEEIVFRAVLFPQVYVRLVDRFRRRWAAITIAIVSTQGAFALLHIPFRIQIGYYDSIWIVLADQALLIGAGCLGILVLVSTRNLGMFIGLHVLYNTPIPLFAPPPDTMRLGTRAAVFLCALIAIALWTWIVVRRERRSEARSRSPGVFTTSEVPAVGD